MLESKNEGRERLSMAHSVLSRLNAKPDMEACEAVRKAVWSAATAAAAHFI